MSSHDFDPFTGPDISPRPTPNRLGRVITALGLVAAVAVGAQVQADIAHYNHHHPEFSIENPISWAATPIADAIESIVHST